MSIEDNKSIVLSLYNARNQRNLTILDQIISPDFITNVPNNPQPLRGPEGVRQTFAAMQNSFPDLTTVINDQIAEGDKVVIICTSRGTNAVPFMGIPPGQHLTTVGIDVWRVVNGKINDYFGVSQLVPFT
jgi:steroid delta-isomerase-like uncharacterized protein